MNNLFGLLCLPTSREDISSSQYGNNTSGCSQSLAIQKIEVKLRMDEGVYWLFITVCKCAKICYNPCVVFHLNLAVHHKTKFIITAVL